MEKGASALSQRQLIKMEDGMMNVECILEFDQVRAKWMELALTKVAKEKIAKSGYCLEESKLLSLIHI